MALVTAKQYGIDDQIVQRAAQLAHTFDALCRPDESAASAVRGDGSYIESEGGTSDHCGDASEKFINDACLAHTGAEDSESEDSVPLVTNNKVDKLSGRRYNLNTDVLPIMRHVCAEGATSNNIQVQGLFVSFYILWFCVYL